MTIYERKLRAFCEGLQMCNIDELMTGTVPDFKRVGEVMTKRINKKIELPDISTKLREEIKYYEDKIKYIKKYYRNCYEKLLPLGEKGKEIKAHQLTINRLQSILKEVE